MSNSTGLAWSAGKGIIAALRLADDIPGAGSVSSNPASAGGQSPGSGKSKGSGGSTQ